MNRTIISFLFLAELLSAQIDPEFIKGLDVSFIPQIEDLGGRYYLDNLQIDPLEIFKMNDINYIRLRLWHSPDNGYCGLAETVEMAARIKNKGFKFLLDVHYSDTWADPTHQQKPSAWQNISFEDLTDSVYSYTYYIVRFFDSMKVLPDMIQIGNEISGGFLWDDGDIRNDFNTPEHWEKFTDLLKSAVRGAKDASPALPIPIMIHTDKGTDNNACKFFFDNLISYQVPFDIIGLSYYPWWQGSLSKLEENLNDLAINYNKDIVLVETAYPWTLTNTDTIENFVDSTSELISLYPPDVEGQFSFLKRLIELIKNIPDNKGKGIFYWAPEYISVPPIYSSWENLTLFDFNGKVLNSFKAFNNPQDDSASWINVTLNLNTSPHLDTISPKAFVQLRGELMNGPDTLASGEKISWNEDSGVILKNINGDYWRANIKLMPGSQLNYKYWIGRSNSIPAFPGLGWEGPLAAYDSSGSYRKFIAATKDTVLSLEYFNPSEDTSAQYWMPFMHKTDSIAVRFKVNTGALVSGGVFDPDNDLTGVSIESADSINIPSGEDANLILCRDSLSINNGSFWSGTLYFPVKAEGLIQSYRFFIENDHGRILEDIPERKFTLHSGDTTLVWVYFNDRNALTNTRNRFLPPGEFVLYQNYPNPFNPSTKINFEIKTKTRINLTVYDYLGEKVNTLADAEKDPGKYTFEWTGKNSNGLTLSSGIYFIRLKAGAKTGTIKALLLK